MSPALIAAVVVVAVLVLAVVLLRVRKLRRDERRLTSRPIDRRLVTPPPSPYQPSQGFRLLDGAAGEAVRPTPARPRLESSRDYVFSELSGPGGIERAPLPNRHDTGWALARSQHRATSGGGLRLLVILVVLVVAVSVAGYALRHRPAHGATTTTLATTTTVETSTTFPPRFVAVSTDAATKSATYDVPTNQYAVTVSGAAGAVWTVYQMGPSNTLEFQGTVASGTSKSLTMTGVSRITLGSPHNASVSVGGRPVTLPTTLYSPLTLVFTPPTG
ncbi:MAG TPA: hypothetical protein VND83_08215 [Acidimicrobiales bacterium]|nr:hypothetical protein [Acidimicrobiales bacterium]